MKIGGDIEYFSQFSIIISTALLIGSFDNYAVVLQTEVNIVT